jgi:hypothetical protein
MAFIILPILSLVLYLVGFFQANLILYMAVAGLVIAVISYRQNTQSDQRRVAKYFSLALIVLGVVLLLCSILSIFAIGPFLSSIL